MKRYKGYSLFNDLKNTTLQDYNRLVTFLNAFSTEGKDMAKGYAQQIPLDERKRLQTLWSRAKKEGLTTISREARESVNG